LPSRRIDGKDIRPLLFGASGAESPHEAFYFYRGSNLEAVRSGHWKLHFPHTYQHVIKGGTDGNPGIISYDRIERSLFDVETDPEEQHNVAAEYPDIVDKLTNLSLVYDQEIKDNRRPCGEVAEPGAIMSDQFTVLSVSDGNVETRSGARWGYDHFLFWLDAKPGACLELGFDLSEPAEGKLSFHANLDLRNGQYRFFLDDQMLGDAVDFFTYETNTKIVYWPERRLSAGKHTLCIELTSCHPDAIEGMNLGIDYFKIG
jgi:hypothetical protein